LLETPGGQVNDRTCLLGGDGFIACVHEWCLADYRLLAELHGKVAHLILDADGNMVGLDASGQEIILGNLND
jgi:hypothetical protein